MLSRAVALILIVALVSQLAGCAAPRARALPGRADAPEDPLVEVGDDVTVTLVDGRALAGRLISLQSDHLVIGRPGNFGWDETEVAFADIDQITVAGTTAWGKVALWGFATVVVAGLVIGVLVSGDGFIQIQD